MNYPREQEKETENEKEVTPNARPIYHEHYIEPNSPQPVCSSISFTPSIPMPGSFCSGYIMICKPSSSNGGEKKERKPRAPVVCKPPCNLLPSERSAKCLKRHRAE